MVGQVKDLTHLLHQTGHISLDLDVTLKLNFDSTSEAWKLLQDISVAVRHLCSRKATGVGPGTPETLSQDWGDILDVGRIVSVLHK